MGKIKLTELEELTEKATAGFYNMGVSDLSEFSWKTPKRGWYAVYAGSIHVSSENKQECEDTLAYIAMAARVLPSLIEELKKYIDTPKEEENNMKDVVSDV